MELDNKQKLAAWRKLLKAMRKEDARLAGTNFAYNLYLCAYTSISFPCASEEYFYLKEEIYRHINNCSTYSEYLGKTSGNKLEKIIRYEDRLVFVNFCRFKFVEFNITQLKSLLAAGEN